MTADFPELNPPARILLGPGPSNVHPRVYRAMMAPVIGYLDPVFLQLLDDTQRPLRAVFRTENDLTIPVSGTGTLGMEAAVYNIVEPGDTAVVCVNGYFGTRIADMVVQTFNRSGLDELCLRSLLVRLSEMAVDLPELTLLQINPLLADRDGVLAHEVHLAIERARPGRPTLAIRPYPSELEEELVLKDRSNVLARPVRPEDESAYTRLLSRLSPEDLYSRFCKAGPVPREVALQLIHIDYDREMTFVATRPGEDGETEIVGVVDSMTASDNREAEYSIFVRTDLKGTGLGRALMEKMIRYCRQRGTGMLYGMVLKNNNAMLSLNFKLGFRPDLDGNADESMEKMVLELSGPRPPHSR